MRRYNFNAMMWEDIERSPRVLTNEELIPAKKPKKRINKQVRKTKVRIPSRTKVSKTSFKFENSPQKDTINTALAKHGNKRGCAIVLDGPNMHTTKTLKKYGWKKENIYIPNFDDNDYKAIKRKHINTFNKPLGTQILGMNRNSVGLIYADYMCSLNGNANCSPLTDMERIFDNKIMMDKSVLGITISMRNHPKEKKAFVNADVQRCISEITRFAYLNKYTAILVNTGGTYKNGGVMWSGLFYIVKV